MEEMSEGPYFLLFDMSSWISVISHKRGKMTIGDVLDARKSFGFKKVLKIIEAYG
jgi:hypothetical protein